MLTESTTEDICPNVCTQLLAKKRKRRDEKIPQISTRIVYFDGGKSSSPATHGNQVMSQVIFYTILGSETKTTFDVPILERKFAVTAENNFVCKRIGPVPENPTLLLLQEGTRQFVQELTDRQTIYGEYSISQQAKARRLHPQAASKERRLHQFAAQLAPTKLNNRSFFEVSTWNSLMDTLAKEAPTPTVRRKEGVTRLHNTVRKDLSNLTTMQSMLTALGSGATEDDAARVKNLVSRLEQDLTKLYAANFEKYGNAFAEELRGWPVARNNAIRAAMASTDSDIVMSDASDVNLSSAVGFVKAQVTDQFKAMSKLQGTVAETAIEVMTDVKSPWARAILPYSVSGTDINGPLQSSSANISIEPCNASAMVGLPAHTARRRRRQQK
jgi:hypothetical protein